ncbi:conserved hypothetical protein [uncultured Desulfatiglans sp.]|uniref:Uncharacterized protein n=1 Tax=Uncultured Desulfatiglans sp. TaxID=1748965 RepID=A0A653A405_UNCDX|nr:conserved hypothetical protein [uncultured Desulfatiglans sp.]
MTHQEAIMAFSQSEKIKGGIIWASTALQSMDALQGMEKRGAEGVIRTLVNLIAHDVQLSSRIAPDEGWGEVQSFLDQALVMVASGVGFDAVHHLTKALSRVTTIGQRAMTVLKEEHLLD